MWRETKVKSVQIFIRLRKFEHNTGVWVGKPDCSDMDMTHFIFISVQSVFPAHDFR